MAALATPSPSIRIPSSRSRATSRRVWQARVDLLENRFPAGAGMNGQAVGAQALDGAEMSLAPQAMCWMPPPR